MMLEDLYKKLDLFRNVITEYVDMGRIENKQRELGVDFPESMIEFYRHFGNDKEFLSSYYNFWRIEDVKICNYALCFGEKHEGIGRLGIEVGDLKTKSQKVSYYIPKMEKWYVEIGASRIFFFRTACWQILNTMPSLARTQMSNTEFKKIKGTELNYLSEDKLLLLSDIIPVFGKNVLGCYFVRDEMLYLGTKNGDEILEEYERILGLDLDWL